MVESRSCFICFHCYFVQHHPNINMPPIEEDKDELQQSKILIPKQRQTPFDNKYEVDDQLPTYNEYKAYESLKREVTSYF